MRLEYGETRRGKIPTEIEASKTPHPIKATETEYMNVSPTTLKHIYDRNTGKKA